MRVLMLSTLCFPFSIGGVENHILNLSRALIKLGHEVEIVVPRMSGFEKGEFTGRRAIQHSDLTIHVIPIRGPAALTEKLRRQFGGGSPLGLAVAFMQKAGYQLASVRTARYLIRLFCERQMDILHQHDFSANILSTKLMARHHPVVLTNHTGEYIHIVSRSYLRPFLRIALSHYKFIIGPSRELADVPYYPKKRVYIPNGVDTTFFLPVGPEKRESVRRGFGLGPDSFVVFCPRRWAPTKGIVHLCRAIRSVVHRVPEACFMFAGSDYEGYPQYKKEVLRVLRDLEDEGISNFRLLGNLGADDIRNWYWASDVVVIPSLMEATSLAALEGMACGLPVLATNVGGMPEIVSEHTGKLVEAANPSALADGILYFWQLGERKRRLMGNAARRFVVDKYDWTRIAEHTSIVYEQALRERKP